MSGKVSFPPSKPVVLIPEPASRRPAQSAERQTVTPGTGFDTSAAEAHEPTLLSGRGPMDEAAAAAALQQAASARSTEPFTTRPHVTRVLPPPFEFDLPPAEIATRLAKAQAACDARIAAIVALPDTERTFDNTVLALEQATNALSDVSAELGFLQNIHTDPDIREASSQASVESGKYFVQLGARRDVYCALKAWAEGPGKSERLEPDQQRLVEETMRSFRRSGLELPDAQLAQLTQIKSRLTELSTQFRKNLNENTDTVELTDAQLRGVPEDFKASLERTGTGGWILPIKDSKVRSFMESCADGEARRKVYLAHNQRESKENTPLLEETLRLRRQAAKLLGYPTHADYATEVQMAKDAATARAFLADLRDKLRPRLEADKARMTELKRAETGDAAARLEPWDVTYYLDKIRKKDYALDSDKVREYFPAPKVFEGMRQFFGDLYGVDVAPVSDAKLWHPTAQLFEVRDRESGEVIGRLYNDLFLRKEGKYSHAACFGLSTAREEQGVYRAPVRAIVCNFDSPTADRPSLLTHDQVTTLFHEFGHAVHGLLTTARYGSQSGTSVPRDFVEVPSQFQEHFAFEPAVLDLISGHYRDESKKLPEDLVRKLKEAREFDAGWHYSRQIFLASFDQALHGATGEVNLSSLDKELYQEILGMVQPADTNFPATFGHLFGYDGRYYSYLWSEVYCDDLFSRFAQEGIGDRALGDRYRDTILALGSSAEPQELMRAFLGREPNNRAFLERLGVDSEPSRASA